MMRRAVPLGLWLILLVLLSLCLGVVAAVAAPEAPADPEVMKWAFLSAALAAASWDWPKASPSTASSLPS